MTVIEHYPCPTCVGTGSMESSDSTDESWWDCRVCKGTGRLADRRRPDPALQGAVEALSIAARALDEAAVHIGHATPSFKAREAARAARIAAGGQ